MVSYIMGVNRGIIQSVATCLAPYLLSVCIVMCPVFLSQGEIGGTS